MDTFVCKHFKSHRSFLSSVNFGYLDYAEAIYEGEVNSQAELGAAERADLQALGIPKGAAGLIVAGADNFVTSMRLHSQPLGVCTCISTL